MSEVLLKISSFVFQRWRSYWFGTWGWINVDFKDTTEHFDICHYSIMALFDGDTRYSVCRTFWESNAFVNPKHRLCECSRVWSPLTHTCAFSITLLDKMAKDWIVLPRTMELPKLRWNKTINHRHPHHTLKSKELTFAQFHHLTTLLLQRWQHC